MIIPKVLLSTFAATTAVATPALIYNNSISSESTVVTKDYQYLLVKYFNNNSENIEGDFVKDGKNNYVCFFKENDDSIKQDDSCQLFEINQDSDFGNKINGIKTILNQTNSMKISEKPIDLKKYVLRIKSDNIINKEIISIRNKNNENKEYGAMLQLENLSSLFADVKNNFNIKSLRNVDTDEYIPINERDINKYAYVKHWNQYSSNSRFVNYSNYPVSKSLASY